jgi:hypothetical protein
VQLEKARLAGATQRLARPLYVGSTPTRASNNLRESFRRVHLSRYHGDRGHSESCSITLVHVIRLKKCLAFLRKHREAIVAFDLFTVPTTTFRMLYCFFVIEHGRRRILHFNMTRQPSADWVVQQLREPFPEAAPYRYAILDRDSIFDANVLTSRRPLG